ncbi:MAG: ATP-binding protein [Pseudomonadota bacterium]
MSYQKVNHEALELLDGQLSQSAKLIMARVHHEQGEAYESPHQVEMTLGGEHHPYEHPLEYQVWKADGDLLLRSGGAPLMPRVGEAGYQVFDHLGQPWRMLTLWAPDHSFQVQVAQSLEARRRVALEVATRVVQPMLIALPLLGLIIYLSVRRAMRPMDRLAQAVAERNPDNLDPLPGNGATPTEVTSLVRALNRLLGRLRAALDNERRFTADAAHELRTPLAAIKIQTQVALASPDEADRQHALRQVLAGTERAGRLVEQLLRLARLDPLLGLEQPVPVRLDRLAAHLAGEVAHQAGAAGRRIELAEGAEAVTVQGDEALLDAALRNLLDNALRHVPQGGWVSLGARAVGTRRELWVRDSGPGVPPEELARLTERFFRGRDRTGEGSGLGLAIVQRVAELHGARLELANHPEGGFLVRIVWP